MGVKQNIISICADFDKTLSPDYMEVPLFEYFGHDPAQFWDEVAELEAAEKKRLLDESCFDPNLTAVHLKQRAGYIKDLAYSMLICDHIHKGCPRDGKKWEGLTRSLLRELGQEVPLFEGLPDAIPYLNERIYEHRDWQRCGIKLEFHVLSAGIFDMIIGTKIGKYLAGAFATEFVSDPDTGLLIRACTPVSDTTKTRFYWMINKGPQYEVNAHVDAKDRRIPTQQMIVMGDGDSDVPLLSTGKSNGSASIVIKNPKDADRTDTVADILYQQGRAHNVAVGDYRPGSELMEILWASIYAQAEHIMRRE